MGRLTRKLENGRYAQNYTTGDGFFVGMTEMMQKLGELEELEEAGRLVELPCALGTTVWTTKWWDDVTETVKVDGKKFHRQVMKHKVTKTKFSLYDLDDFGKTVFLTRREAEAALKGGE